MVDDRKNGYSGEEPTNDLVQAAKEGDLEAWNHLDQRYRNALSLFMRGKIPSDVRRRFDTEDVLQSAFLRAFKELDSYQYQGKGSFHRWLTQILSNRLLSRMRGVQAQKRDSHRERQYTESQSDVRDEPMSETPSELMSMAENQARLVEALSDLPEEDRQAISLHYFDKKPLASVAAELGISEATVRRHLSRGIEAITRKMKAGGYSNN